MIRTPPYNSWKNPAKQCMLLLNIALQGTGIARCATVYEDNLRSCNSMKQIQMLAEEIPGVKSAITDSVQAPKSLLYS